MSHVRRRSSRRQLLFASAAALAAVVGVVLAVYYGARDSAEPRAACEREARAVAPWVLTTSGEVSALAVHCGVVYVAGSLSEIGRQTGAFAVTGETGAPAARAAQVMGWGDEAESVVSVIVSDGRNGWFIGGDFAEVGGRPCPRLAHILSDGSSDPDWCPRPNRAVRALALRGGVLFVGGAFTRIGGARRHKLAAISVTRGTATPWRASVGGARVIDRHFRKLFRRTVDALAVRGRTLYVGGFFAHVGGAARASVAAVDAETGRVTPWNPGVGTRGLPGVLSVTSVVPDRRAIYIAGDFAKVGGRSRAGIAAISYAGEVLAWNAHLRNGEYPGTVRAVALDGDRIFIGGSFTRVGGDDREIVAGLDARTGKALPWSPRLRAAEQGEVTGITVRGGRVYVAGNFIRGGRHTAIALDAKTAREVRWDIQPNGPVRAVASARNRIAVGGLFTAVRGVRRTGLAAIEIATGRILPWAPRPDEVDEGVAALLVDDTKLWVGGSFERVNGERRSGVAAFDLQTMELDEWRGPNLAGSNYGVTAFARNDDDLYIGGDFSAVGGVRRWGLAALDRKSGELLDWRADVAGRTHTGNGEVYDLLADDDRLWIAGDFNAVGGARRHGVAVARLDDGRVLGWNARIDPELTGGLVYALARGPEPRGRRRVLPRGGPDAVPHRAGYEYCRAAWPDRSLRRFEGYGSG